MDRQEDIEELKKQAPTLFGLDKVDSFEVPDGFFDHFPHNVQDSVKGVHAGVQIPFWKGLVIALPLIAVIVAVSGILIKMSGDPAGAGYTGIDVFEIEEVLEYAEADELLASLDPEDLPETLFEEVDLEGELDEEYLEDYIEEL